MSTSKSNAQTGQGADRRLPGERLSRQAVLRAALAFIDRDGLDRLTMRKIGAELDVQAMALYRYTPSRADLIAGVVELAADELCGDVLLLPGESWQDYLHRLAHGLRRLALAHPALFPLVATRPLAGLRIGVPLPSLRWTESLLAGLISRGFSDEAATHAYRAFSSLVLGRLLLEVSVPAGALDTGPIAGEGLAGYPVLGRLSHQLVCALSGQEFDESLAILMRCLARRDGQPGTARQDTAAAEPDRLASAAVGAR